MPGAAAEGATEPVLVVDFGTTTSAAMLVADGAVRPVHESRSGLWAWPSAVVPLATAAVAGLLVGAVLLTLADELDNNSALDFGEASLLFALPVWLLPLVLSLVRHRDEITTFLRSKVQRP